MHHKAACPCRSATYELLEIIQNENRDDNNIKLAYNVKFFGKSEGRMFLLGRFKPETRIEELASGSSWSVASHHRARLRGKHDGRMAELYGQECPSALAKVPHR